MGNVGVLVCQALLLCLGALPFAAAPAWAQRPAMDFRHLSLEEGLSHSTVYSILQDSRGFIWFGTKDGLNRYDGYTFTVYRGKTGTLRDYVGRIWDICEDRNGDLWVGTDQGLYFFDRSTDQLTRYAHPPGRPDLAVPRSVRSILLDRRGDLWLGSFGGGLVRMNPEAGLFRRYRHDPSHPDSLVSDYIWEVFEDREGRLWIGTTHGLDLFESASNRFVSYPVRSGEDERDVRSANTIRRIYQDRNGTLWVGSMGGVHRFDEAARTFTTYAHDPSDPGSLSQNYVRAITEDRHGHLLLGTERGIDLLDPERDRFHHYRHDPLDPYSLNNDPVYALATDRQGNLWVGTYHDGVNVHYHRDTGFEHVRPDASGRGLSGRVTRTLLEDSRGRLWIATEDAGLNVLLPEERTYRHFRHDPGDPGSLLSDNIHGLAEDARHRLWVGSYGGGLNHLDPETGEVTRYTHDDDDSLSLSSNNVLDLLIDSQQRLWVGTAWGGLDRFEPRTRTFAHYPSDGTPGSLSHNTVTCLYEDRRGRLWVGTPEGLNLYEEEDGTFRVYRHDPRDTTSLTNSHVTSLLQDRTGRLWVGTLGGGLNLFHPETQTFTGYGVRDGLPSNHVYSLEEDTRGRLWISTNAGLSRYDPATQRFTNYTQRDGLQSNQFNPTSSTRLRSGELLFGGINGYNRFHPDSLRYRSYMPPVVLTDLQIRNRSVPIGEEGSPLQRHISETERIELPHDEAFLTFSFVALDFAPEVNTQYAYRMRGIHDDWHYVGTQRTATYANLPPGTYTFEVKASNRGDRWPAGGASVHLTVHPPFWRSWYAYLVYAALIAGLLYLFKHYSLIEVRRKHDLILERVQREKERALHETKLRFFTNVSHELRTPLTLITAPLETLSERFGDDASVSGLLRSMRRNTHRLLRMVNQVMDLRKIDANLMRLQAGPGDLTAFVEEVIGLFDEAARQKQVTYTFESDHPSLTAWFDRDKLETALVNLLSNALRHTGPGGSVHVALRCETAGAPGEGHVELSVTDEGPGIPPEDQAHIFERFYQVAHDGYVRADGTGIGLFLSRELVALHHGQIRVESEPGERSTFTIRLPLGREHLSDEEIAPVVAGGLSHGDGFEAAALLAVEPAAEAAPVPDQDPEAARERALVLVVDDEEELRNYIRDILSDTYRVATAADGTAGWEAAQELRPDLIISDVMMPGTDGVTLCDRVKRFFPTSDIPVILLTAHRTSREDEQKGLETGADEYLVKPFHPSLLKTRVQNLIDARSRVRTRVQREALLEPSDAPPSIEEDFLQQAVAAVEAHMSDPDLDVQTIADALHVSRSTAYRKIKELTGRPLGAFIRHVRLRRAAQLLAQGDQTVAQVTYAVGYSDLSYFRECFRKEFDVNPSEYKGPPPTEQPERSDAESSDAA